MKKRDWFGRGKKYSQRPLKMNGRKKYNARNQNLNQRFEKHSYF